MLAGWDAPGAGSKRFLKEKAEKAIQQAKADGIEVYGAKEAAAKALGNRAFARLLASAGSTPYSAAWYQRSAGWHIKQEVK